MEALSPEIRNQVAALAGDIAVGGNMPDAKPAAVLRPAVSDGEIARWKNDVQQKIDSGEYFPLKPEHAENYNELTQKAREAGYKNIDVVVEAEKTSWMNIVTTGKDEATVVVSEDAVKATLQYKLDRKQYIELDPSLAANYDWLKEQGTQAGLENPRVMMDMGKQDGVNVGVKELPGGERVVRAIPDAVEFTPELASRALMISDADVSKNLETGKFKTAREAGVTQDVLDAMAASTGHRNEINPSQRFETPELYVSGKSDGDPVGAHRTREGKPYILVDESFLKLPANQQKGVLEHELAHYEAGDVTAEAIAQRVNAQRRTGNNDHVRAMEERADKTGVCHSPNPDETARSLADAIEELKLGKRSTHPDPKTRPGDIRNYPGQCEPDGPPLKTPGAGGQSATLSHP